MKIQIIIVSLCLLFLNACSGEDKSREQNQVSVPKDLPKIGVLLYKNDDYINTVSLALKLSLEGQAELVMLSAEGNELVQEEQLGSLLASNVQALAVNLVNPQSAARVLEKIKKAGITVLFFNREPNLKTLDEYSKAAFVGTLPAQAGRLQGELVHKLWKSNPGYDTNGDGKLQYVLLQGNTDNPEALARTEFSVRQAMELGVPMQQLGTNYVCNWDFDLAKQCMVIALAQFGTDIELVLANNDSMALGAIATLQSQGFNQGDKPIIPVLGVDATPEALKAISSGYMSGTVKQDGPLMGQVIAQMLLNSVQGKELLQGTNQVWDESGLAVRLPYSSATPPPARD